MGKGLTNVELVRKVTRLAFGRPNDAVRLVFMDADNQEVVDSLDLSMVEDVKRHSNGTVEVKLLNRVELFKLLAELLQGDEKGSSAAEEFFRSLDRAAEKLGGDKNEVGV